MYNPQETANRIKETAKKRNISISKILQENNLGKGTITKMTNGADVFVQTIYKISNSLNCSVDFLLGRSEKEFEEPEDEHRLLKAYRKLTDEAKKAVLQNVEVTAEIPQYQKYTDIPKAM